MHNKSFMIVGAQFDNKGAQSMLFVTIDELRKRFGDCKIYFASTDFIDENIYNFNHIYFSDREKKIALGAKNCKKALFQAILKDGIKVILGQNNNWGKYYTLNNILPTIDLIIDISGFNIGDKWDYKTHVSYFDNIRLARKFKIPMIILPQSFGPFSYIKKKEKILFNIRELFKYPKIIYARETEGYQQLKNLFHLKQVELSTDLVLQNSGINLKNIYKDIPKIQIPSINMSSNVGIVPNQQCFKHGNANRIYSIYKSIIKSLLNSKKEIYIFRHSHEDQFICKNLKKMFENETRVHLISNDFTCFEYNKFITSFDFIISSRFHSIVHAYKNYIPCILLGWAIKYSELASNVNQSQYSFDITSKDSIEESILKAIEDLNCNLEKNKKILEFNVKNIQENNCFKCLDELESLTNE